MIIAMYGTLHKVFAGEQKKTVADIWALIHASHENKQTGVVRLVSERGETLYLFLKRGSVINSYVVASRAVESLTSEQWNGWINSVDSAYAKSIPLSPQGMLIYKLLIQNVEGKPEAITGPAEIAGFFETQKQTPDASLVKLEWENSMGAVLLLGPSSSPYSLFVSSEYLYDQTGIAPAILNPEHPSCSATVFGADQSVKAWQEVLLRSIFGHVSENVLSRIQMVTGRAVVDSLTRLIVTFASRRGLDIRISSLKVVDGEVFPSPQQAADHYQLLFTEMFMRLSGIIGPRLTTSTLWEVDASLSAQERAVISTFSLLSKGYIYERKS